MLIKYRTQRKKLYQQLEKVKRNKEEKYYFNYISQYCKLAIRKINKL